MSVLYHEARLFALMRCLGVTFPFDAVFPPFFAVLHYVQSVCRPLANSQRHIKSVFKCHIAKWHKVHELGYVNADTTPPQAATAKAVNTLLRTPTKRLLYKYVMRIPEGMLITSESVQDLLIALKSPFGLTKICMPSSHILL